MKRRASRRGYAMVLVLVFIGLVLSCFSLSYRHLGAALRVESADTLLERRNEGSTVALGAGVALLETGVPPTDPYACGVSIETSSGVLSYVVSYAKQSDEPLIWSVESRPMEPYESPEAMPATFAPPEEPEEPPAE